jgi:hypothetical protein
MERRMDGLGDAPRPGAARKITDEQVEVLVTRIWRAFGLKPHVAETWKLSTDPEFIGKVRDVVGLCMSPPENALVLCVDEKSQIQALDRTAPCLPALHPRFHLHFTPASPSWMNLVERWLAELTNRKLRRSAHRSVTELETGIRKWTSEWNKDPKPFTWTKTADEILETLAACCQRIIG